MSTAQVEVVKLALRAYSMGDPEVSLQLASPNILWDDRGSRPDGVVAEGRDAVIEAMHEYLAGWQEYSFQAEKIADAGPGGVVGACRERGTDLDGFPLDRRFGVLWVVQDGLITYWATYSSPAEAAAAAKELAASGTVPEPVPAAPERDSSSEEFYADEGEGLAATGSDPEGPEFSTGQRRAAKRRARVRRWARRGKKNQDDE